MCVHINNTHTHCTPTWITVLPLLPVPNPNPFTRHDAIWSVHCHKHGARLALKRWKHCICHSTPEVSVKIYTLTHTLTITFINLCVASLHACRAHTHVGQSKTCHKEEGCVWRGRGAFKGAPNQWPPNPKVATVMQSLSARACRCQGDVARPVLSSNGSSSHWS